MILVNVILTCISHLRSECLHIGSVQPALSVCLSVMVCVKASCRLSSFCCVVNVEFHVNLMAENEATLTCAKPSYLRMKLWKVENGISATDPPTSGGVSYGPDEETTLASSHNDGSFHFT